MRTVSPRESVISGPTSTMTSADNSYFMPGFAGAEKIKPANRHSVARWTNSNILTFFEAEICKCGGWGYNASKRLSKSCK
jgi:hypothetical protein